MDGETIMNIHEVIDHGGEAISGSEYYNVGKITEFRSGDWLACVKNGDFNCLNGFGNVSLKRSCLFLFSGANTRVLSRP